MKSALVLRTKTTTARNLLGLLMTVPEQTKLCADRSAITRGAFELKTDPLVLRRHVVLINQLLAFLIRHDHIQHTTIPDID
jgi:hypothetical protein